MNEMKLIYLFKKFTAIHKYAHVLWCASVAREATAWQL